ncbi:type VII secretion protein EccCa [Prauserella marina]
MIVRRPLRRPAPELPSGDTILEAPPENPEPSGKGWTRMLMIVPMLAIMGGMILMISMRFNFGPIMYIAGGLMAVGMGGMMLFMMLNQSNQGTSKQEMILNRRRYMRRLSQLRVKVRDSIGKQQAAMYYRHPDPARLWSTAQSARLWERRPLDWDFLVVRLGVGEQELATPLVPPQTRPVDELEPLCAMALRRFVTKYSTVPDLPIAVALHGFSHIYVTGDTGAKRALARAITAQLATFHAPGDVILGAVTVPDERASWEWFKWIPHALHPNKADAVGNIRLVTDSVVALESMLDDVFSTRPRFNPGTPPAEGLAHVVVFLDGGPVSGSEHLMADGGVEGVTVVNLADPPPRVLDASTLVLDIATDGELTSKTMDGEGKVGTADALDLSDMRGLARMLAPLRLSVQTATDQPLAGGPLELTDLLDLGDPHAFSLAETWSSRSNRSRLRVAIGVHADGRPMELDLKESAQDGMGPHGLLVGATGSGKSELLRTLVLALATTHDPETLNFVLTDFKGGATFTKLDQLPHTSAVITNLEDELHLVDRMLDAIQGELMRRQELLRKTGDFNSQYTYEKARAAGAPLEPLPALLVIVDEFSELLTARPDFIDMFVQIGRVGRSLGVHLLLASQRLDEGRLRGLESHLSYRIALRTFSAMESRTVLGVPDAAQLPRSPGNGFVKADSELARFKAAYVSGPIKNKAAVRTDKAGNRIVPVQEYTTHYLRPKITDKPEPDTTTAADNENTESLLEVLVDRMKGQGRPAHQVWLPPLAEPPTLPDLVGPLGKHDRRGLTTTTTATHGTLSAVVGIIDKPFEQRRDPYWIDLSGAGGNIVVIGAPRSGKSVAIRTILATLALTHTPAEVQFACLDFGGGGLTAIRDLAHVSGVATRRDTDTVRRAIAEAHGLLQERERAFAEHGIDSMATYRRRLRNGDFPTDRFGDLFLIVDGWSTLRTEFEDLEPTVAEILNRGLGYGIHVIAGCNRWMDLRMNTRDMFGTRLELRLGDPLDSQFGRKHAASVPENTPGRGITPEGLHFLAGVPRIDGQHSDEGLGEATAALVPAINNAWDGNPAAKVRLLPAVLPYEDLPPADTAPTQGIAIGISERDLQPVHLNFDTEPHLLAIGDVETGKSSLLRALATSIMARYQPDQAQIALIDYRRSMLGLVPDDYLIGYATNQASVKRMTALTVDAMTKRLPSDDITPQQLKNRTWWTGPELFLLIDDYDLVTSGHDNPLPTLLDYMTQGRDIGLHLIITRRSGGAGRALFDPVLSRIKELASPAIMLSGNRDEGPLFDNRRPQKLPPGRAWLITRTTGHQMIQLAHLPMAT